MAIVTDLAIVPQTMTILFAMVNPTPIHLGVGIAKSYRGQHERICEPKEDT